MLDNATRAVVGDGHAIGGRPGSVDRFGVSRRGACLGGSGVCEGARAVVVCFLTIERRKSQGEPSL